MKLTSVSVSENSRISSLNGTANWKWSRTMMTPSSKWPSPAKNNSRRAFRFASDRRGRRLKFWEIFWKRSPNPSQNFYNFATLLQNNMGTGPLPCFLKCLRELFSKSSLLFVLDKYPQVCSVVLFAFYQIDIDKKPRTEWTDFCALEMYLCLRWNGVLRLAKPIESFSGTGCFRRSITIYI